MNKIFASIVLASVISSMPLSVNAETEPNVNDILKNKAESTGENDSVYTSNEDFDKGEMTGVSYHDNDDELTLSKQYSNFNSLFFTLKDIIIFGYEDNTSVTVCSQNGQVVWTGIVNRGEEKVITVDQGVYKANADKKMAILSGDPVSNKVSGYYAMDSNGYGASTDLYTWVPEIYSTCKFIIFAMEDNTEVELTNAKTGALIYQGTLNKGEHYVNSNLSACHLHIKANNKVSALTDYDQSYYAPDVNGKWSGTEFYTHLGNTGRWTHELTVTSFSDNNKVSIIDTETEQEVWSGTLNKGECKVLPYSRGTDTYFTVKSDDTVTVLAQPWNTMTASYQQGVYVADESGTGIGKNFYPTALSDGYLYAFAYTDNTEINLYDNTGTTLIKSYKLNAGEYVDLKPGSGMFNVTSSKNISLYSGCMSASAGFVPVQYNDIERPTEGTWNIIKEADTNSNYWSDLKWTEKIPEGTNIKVRARVANSKDDLNNAIYVDVVNGVPNEELRGKYIQVDVEFTTTNENSPVLKDITIGNLEEYNSVITADAGDDQEMTIPSEEDSCKVALDASKSYDLNGNLLSYKWTWDGREAEGVNPNINLTPGKHEIKLVVSNKYNYSKEDTVIINVNKELAPMEINDFTAVSSKTEGNPRYVKINADAIGEGKLQYKFIVLYNGEYVESRSYKDKSSWIWKPAVCGRYTIICKAKDETGREVSKVIHHYVNKAYKFKINDYNANSLDQTGKNVKLSMSTIGKDNNISYKFVVMKDGEIVNSRPYGKKNTCIIRNLETGEYMIYFKAKDENGNELVESMKYEVK